MVRRLRRIVVGRGVAAALALLVCAGSGGWEHSSWDDTECDPFPVHHDHNAHHLTADTHEAPVAGRHCYLCHLLRLLHTSIADRGVRVWQPAESSWCFAFDLVFANDILHLALPSRAPPIIIS